MDWKDRITVDPEILVGKPIMFTEELPWLQAKIANG